MSGLKARRLPGHDDAFFFRKDEQRYLSDRVRHSGITVIKGGPRSGKSWLVGRVLRFLNNKEWPQPLIGFCRCSAQDRDNLMRVIDDLAISWRERASLFDQAQEIIKQNTHRWPQIITDAVSCVIKPAELFGPASALIANTLKSLPGLEPGSYVPRLKYEHGQELIKALTEIAQAERVILVLDQWEQSSNLKYELEHLQNFSRDWRDWPPTHFLITIRSGGEADHLLEEFCTGQTGFCEMYPLPVFETESDLVEKGRLTTYLTDNVSACRSVDNPDHYLLHIQGYPAVLDNWTRSINTDKMHNLDDLARVAGQAQNGRYPEFGDLVPQLPPSMRKLSIRLGLLPNLTDESWCVLKPILMDGVEPSCLDDLLSRKLLEGIEPPSFGHQQRSDYFQRWLLDHRKTETDEQCRILVRKLAGQIQEISPAALPFAAALVALAPKVKVLMTDNTTEGLCEAAISCLGVHVRGDALLQGRTQWCAPQQSDVVKLVAAGLVNTGIAAKAENDLPRRNALLDELRALAQAHPTDAAVREQLAKGLFNTGNAAKAENDLPRRNALLDELRALAQAHPTDAAVREQLAKGLVNTGNAAKAENDLPRRNALLDELRALAQAHPTDAAVREQLAKGLFNTGNAAKAENDLPRRNALLDELRALAQAHPTDAAVREQLANGLVNTGNAAKAENDLPRRDALLDELRALAQAHPTDAAVREQLANGLFNTGNAAKAENDLPRRNALLDELRALAQAHPTDAAVRERLANGLVNTGIDAEAENDLPRRNALLDELRALAQAHPTDAAVREQLANGLVNTGIDAEAENDLPRRNALLDELRALAQAHPTDAAVREQLANGLVNTGIAAEAENDLPRQNALLDELRALAQAHPPII